MARKTAVVDEMDQLAAMLPPPKRNETLAALEDAMGEFKLWRPAMQELREVESVPTCFPYFDMKTRVGGYPIGGITTVHGPSGHGKTYFTVGLGLSYLMRNHVFGLIDAERTTPPSWMRQTMAQLSSHPGFVALRPPTYEDAIDATKQLCEGVANKREKGLLPKDTTVLIGVDSIRKLVPKDLMDKLRKDGADGLGGRSEQLKAKMNQAWIDTLTPMLDDTRCSVVLIARERDRAEATADDKKFDKAWEIGGGKGVIYDASLVCRVTRAAWVYEKGSGDDDAKKAIGEKHRVRIWKSKVEAKDGQHSDAFFHTSNGALVAPGFDRARDVLELGVQLGVIDQSGSWFSCGGERLGNGKNAVVKSLHSNPPLLTAVETAVRAAFERDADDAPVADDDDE